MRQKPNLITYRTDDFQKSLNFYEVRHLFEVAHNPFLEFNENDKVKP